jgi:hypothetical protein
LDDRVALVIEIIGQKGILEANLASRGMDCDCTNGRDPPMRIRDAMVGILVFLFALHKSTANNAKVPKKEREMARERAGG